MDNENSIMVAIILSLVGCIYSFAIFFYKADYLFLFFGIVWLMVILILGLAINKSKKLRK